MNKVLASIVLLLSLAPSARAAAITAGQNVTSASAGALRPAGPGNYSGNLVSEAGLTYSNTYLLDMAQYNAREVSIQTVFSTVTFSSPSVSDGRKSSGTVTVTDYTALSSAAATIQVTVTTNSFATLPTLTFWNCALKMGRDFSKGATRNATATNLAAAIALCNTNLSAAASGNVIYTTATYGSYANSYAFTSDNSSVTVSASVMSGGKDNACLTINGTALCANSAFTAATSSVTTANNIAVAINANSTLSAVIVSTSDHNTGSAYGKLTIASKLNGSAYNYAITSSSPTALTVKDGANLIGGADSGFTLSSGKIVASAASGLTLALPVLYAVGSNPALGGLTTGTTYYAVPYSATGFYLAKYSTSAVAGLTSDYVTITSTNSGTTANSYTFAPLDWTSSSANPASFVLQVSNDNSNWSTAPSTGTVTIATMTAATTLSNNFGVLGYRYLRLNYTTSAGGSGATALTAPVYLKQD
jgi:hypothetical protein